MKRRAAITFLFAVVLACLLIILGFIAARPAHAAGQTTNWPTVTAPAWDRGHAKRATPHVVDIQVQGKPRAWGLRGFAVQVDRAVGGIRIHYGAGQSCRRFSGRYCVTVKAWRYPRAGWWGITNYRTHGAVIRLNSKYGVQQWAAAHEFLHALGEQHHRYGHGMLRLPTPSMQQMSRGELRALWHQYGR